MGKFIGGAAGGIKSINDGTITIATSSTTGTAAISSVDLDNSILLYEGIIARTNDYRKDECRIDITSSTLVTATKNQGDATYTSTVKFMVVEFYGGIKNIQEGTVTIGGTDLTGTAAISVVDIDKAILLYEGLESPSIQPIAGDCAIEFSASTQITATRFEANATTTTAGFMVVEFF